jgi:hypothetical protein
MIARNAGRIVMAKGVSFSAELSALGVVLGALEPLDEDERKFVVRTVLDRLGIGGDVVGRAGKQGNAGGGSGLDRGTGDANLADVKPKDFLKDKQPITDVQRVACLAYYLTHARETPHFKTLDLTKLNTDAAGQKFSNTAVAVRNATSQSGFLAPAGSGRKQITGLGEDVVRGLPDQESVRTILTAAKEGRRRRSSKKDGKKK